MRDDAIERLVERHHLPVPEQKALGTVTAAELRAAVLRLVARDGGVWTPSGDVARTDDGRWQVGWEDEIGVARMRAETEVHDTPEAAAAALVGRILARALERGKLDGVPIERD